MGKRTNVPKAVREQCWLNTVGKQYESKCYVRWCKNRMNVFDFHVGHDIPASKGGTLDIDNLRPICSRCNLSMSNTYTIRAWNELTHSGEKPLSSRHQTFFLLGSFFFVVFWFPTASSFLSSTALCPI